jgi:phosphoribosyl 1,2-cyclic phosphodiesterase
MESNHDVEMLMNGNRPYHIKQRILSDVGHLSNKQSSEYLTKFCGSKTKYIFLAHLSEDNNNELLAKSSLLENLEKQHKEIKHIIVAKQNEKTELIEI